MLGCKLAGACQSGSGWSRLREGTDDDTGDGGCGGERAIDVA